MSLEAALHVRAQHLVEADGPTPSWVLAAVLGITPRQAIAEFSGLELNYSDGAWSGGTWTGGFGEARDLRVVLTSDRVQAMRNAEKDDLYTSDFQNIMDAQRHHNPRDRFAELFDCDATGVRLSSIGKGVLDVHRLMESDVRLDPSLDLLTPEQIEAVVQLVTAHGPSSSTDVLRVMSLDARHDDLVGFLRQLRVRGSKHRLMYGVRGNGGACWGISEGSPGINSALDDIPSYDASAHATLFRVDDFHALDVGTAEIMDRSDLVRASSTRTINGVSCSLTNVGIAALDVWDAVHPEIATPEN